MHKLFCYVLLTALLTTGNAYAAAKKKPSKSQAATPVHGKLAEPLAIAVGNCDLEAVKGLIDAGANVNDIPPSIGASIALYTYAKFRDVGGVQCTSVYNYINALKPDLSKRTIEGTNIFSYAITRRIEDFNYFRSKGIKSNITDKNGRTYIQREIIKFGEILDPFFSSIISNAGERESQSELLYTVMRIIIEEPGVLNNRDANGETALIQAVLTQRYSIAQWLLTKGADFSSIKDRKGKTAYDYALASGNGDIIGLMSKAKTNSLPPWPADPPIPTRTTINDTLPQGKCGNFSQKIPIIAAGNGNNNYAMLPIDTSCFPDGGIMLIKIKVGHGESNGSFNLFAQDYAPPTSGDVSPLAKQYAVPAGSSRVMGYTFEKPQVFKFASQGGWASRLGSENIVDIDVSFTPIGIPEEDLASKRWSLRRRNGTSLAPNFTFLSNGKFSGSDILATWNWKIEGTKIVFYNKNKPAIALKDYNHDGGFWTIRGSSTNDSFSTFTLQELDRK